MISDNKYPYNIFIMQVVVRNILMKKRIGPDQQVGHPALMSMPPVSLSSIPKSRNKMSSIYP